MRGLLAIPGARSMTAAGLLGRVPMSMVTLAITLLVVDRTGSYALAGAVTAAQTLAMAVVAPYGSRAADRFGQGRVLPLLVIAHGACLVTLVLVSGPLWIVVAALAGACMPMMGSMVRARWTEMVDDPQVRTSAFALETALDEGALIVGPLAASMLALAVSPVLAVLTAATLLVIGGLWLSVQRATAPPAFAPKKREQGHPVRQRGMPAVVAVMACVGGVFGTYQVSTVAFGEATNPAWVGVLMASFSLGSLLSGLYLAGRKREWPITRQLRIGTLTLTVSLLPLMAVSTPVAYAGIALVAGLSVSVVMVGAFALVERLVPDSRLTESLSSVAAAISLGLSAGSWLGGVAIDARGPSLALALCAGCAGLAGIIFWVRMPGLRRLERAAEPVPA